MARAKSAFVTEPNNRPPSPARAEMYTGDAPSFSTLRARLPRQTSLDRVALCLRPEALRLLAEGETPPPGWRVLSGTLQDVEYLGAMTRFTVRLADGTLLSVMALTPPAASGDVSVAYDPARVVVLEDDA